MREVAVVIIIALLGATVSTAQQPNELIDAARNGDRQAVARLLEAGANVETADRYGTTALLAAAGAGHIEVVRMLLAAGADPNHRESFYGSDALGTALFRGHPEVAMLLLSRGAEDRESALELAIRQGDTELARAAVESGPLYTSRLEALRDRAAELDPAIQRLIARAESRPDPAPPHYTLAELSPFTGSFEGWDSDLRVVVSIIDELLALSVDGRPPVTMQVVGEGSFHAEQGEIDADFWGRAGTIESLALRRAGADPEILRRSVAEPVGASGMTAKRDQDWAVAGPTIHWPSFRGANAAGVGDGVDTLTSWNLESGEGILWRADLPGLGNSSPIVWGEKVFVTTAVAEDAEQKLRTGLTGEGTTVNEGVSHSWRVLAFEKKTGRRLWETEVGRALPLTERHFKATQANSTPATDGRHLVVVFPTAGLACLDLDGNIRWRNELGGLNAGAFSDPGIQWGFASSPVLYGARAILQVDIHDGGYLASWDLDSGKQLWRTERQVAPSWSTPVVVAGPGGEELVVNGSTIHAYDPQTGRELWSLGPNSELVIAAPVVGEQVVYVSAGYPPVKPIYAVRAGTRGALEVDPAGDDERLVWSHGIGGAYMPTPLLYRGLYYVVHHNGRLVAYDAESGTPILKSRFSRGGVFTASPIAVNGKLYLPTEEGMLYILEAGPEYKEIAVHEFGEPLMATPAVSAGVLFIRTPSKLIAIGERTPPATRDRHSSTSGGTRLALRIEGDAEHP